MLYKQTWWIHYNNHTICILYKKYINYCLTYLCLSLFQMNYKSCLTNQSSPFTTAANQSSNELLLNKLVSMISLDDKLQSFFFKIQAQKQVFIKSHFTHWFELFSQTFSYNEFHLLLSLEKHFITHSFTPYSYIYLCLECKCKACWSCTCIINAPTRIHIIRNTKKG